MGVAAIIIIAIAALSLTNLCLMKEM